ncbi:MAG: hypothetical protein V3T28_06180 [Gemmatimonadales bacterium]
MGLVPGAPAAAQERDQELDERIRERFTSMLRSELALADDQAETVLPAMAELQQFKREIGRERRETVRALRTGMHDGASDAELQRLLDRFEQIDDDQRSAERSAMAKIDADLNTRQRVKLRFFVQRFRRQIEERLSNRAERMDRQRMRQEGSRHPDRR